MQFTLIIRYFFGEIFVKTNFKIFNKINLLEVLLVMIKTSLELSNN